MSKSGMWGAIYLMAYLRAKQAAFGAERERLFTIAAYARARYLNSCRMARA
jgi:hypothetical protein